MFNRNISDAMKSFISFSYLVLFQNKPDTLFYEIIFDNDFFLFVVCEYKLFNNLKVIKSNGYLCNAFHSKQSSRQLGEKKRILSFCGTLNIVVCTLAHGQSYVAKEYMLRRLNLL